MLDTKLPSGTFRCALTQCQLGRAHHFLETHNPVYLRSPSNNFQFPATPDCEITEADMIVPTGADVIWKSPRNLRSNVIVETGAKLYIYCRVGMPEGATITVQPGGRLFLYGEVYNNCDGKLWEGVVVEGKGWLPQAFPPDDQGYFVLHDGSIIEGANMSIRIKSGGMVLANGANISNSGGMLYEPYGYPQKGYFTKCNFTCDGNIYDFGPYTFKHVALESVKNAKFTGCRFSVENVPPSQSNNTLGIRSHGSTFGVYSSGFVGFGRGVTAYPWYSPINAFTVEGCTFSNNKTGIFALGMQDFRVTDNLFEVGGDDFQSGTPCGLMMDNCTGYKVEGNAFYGENNISAGRYGIITEDSGDDANFISGNSFDYLDYGNLAQGDNRGDFEGLEYHCNTNGGNNPRDFFVPGNRKQQEGIHINQGNGLAALNTFSHFGAFTDGDFRNEVGTIIYNHINDPAHEPVTPTGLNTVQVTPEVTCPSDETCCKERLTTAEWQQAESDFTAAKNSWQTESTELSSLMDGGDTGALLAGIESAGSQNPGQLIQQLLGLSPYLSPEALVALVGKADVLPGSAVTAVLNANPESLRHGKVRDAVQAGFPPVAAGAILANAANQTERTQKENLIGRHRSAMLRKADLLIQDLVKDTVQINAPLIRTWLANKESLEASYAIVGSYLWEGDHAAAAQKLGEIPQAFQLDGEGMSEHALFTDLVSLTQDVPGLSGLGAQQVSDIQHIADNSTRRAGAIAQGILNTWYGGSYRVVPLLPDVGGQFNLMAPPTGNSTALPVQHLAAFPNPARNSVTFRWDLPEGVEGASILLSDLQGRTIEAMEITGQDGKKEWGTEKVEHGVYLYRLLLPDGTLETHKLTIIK